MTESTIAEIAALATLAINGSAGAAAAVCWWRVQPRSGAWLLLRIGQGTAAAQAAIAGGLAISGYHPADGLYWLYALLPVAIGFMAEQLRIVSAEQILENREIPDAQAVGKLADAEQRSLVLAIARREIGVAAAGALVVAVLALRAALIV